MISISMCIINDSLERQLELVLKIKYYSGFPRLTCD